MDQAQLEQMLQQFPPEVILQVGAMVLQARPLVEVLMQIPPEQLQQLLGALQQQLQGGQEQGQGQGQGQPSPEEQQMMAQQQGQANMYGA